MSLNVVEVPSNVKLSSASGAIGLGVLAGAFLGWAIRDIVYVNKKRNLEKDAGVPESEQAKISAWTWILLILGIILAIGAGGGLYYVRKTTV